MEKVIKDRPKGILVILRILTLISFPFQLGQPPPSFISSFSLSLCFLLLPYFSSTDLPPSSPHLRFLPAFFVISLLLSGQPRWTVTKAISGVHCGGRLQGKVSLAIFLSFFKIPFFSTSFCPHFLLHCVVLFGLPPKWPISGHFPVTASSIQASNSMFKFG